MGSNQLIKFFQSADQAPDLVKVLSTFNRTVEQSCSINQRTGQSVATIEGIPKRSDLQFWCELTRTSKVYDKKPVGVSSYRNLLMIVSTLCVDTICELPIDRTFESFLAIFF